MLRSIGWQELMIVLVIVLLLFGPKRLPQLGKMFGKTMRNVKEGIDGKFDEEDKDNAELPKAEPVQTTESETKNEAEKEKVG